MRYIDHHSFDETKTYWYVETKHFTYRANNLTEALLRWFQHRNPLAKDDVESVGRVG